MHLSEVGQIISSAINWHSSLSQDIFAIILKNGKSTDPGKRRDDLFFYQTYHSFAIEINLLRMYLPVGEV